MDDELGAGLALAESHLKARRPHEAEQICRRLLNRHGNHWRIQQCLGNAAAGVGRFDVAEESFRTALSLNPEIAILNKSLGDLLIRRGKTDEGITFFRKAIEQDSRLAGAHNALGSALARAGLFPAAEESFRLAVGLEQKNPWFRNNLANVLKNLGQLDEAIELYQKALAMDPKLAGAHSGLGQAFLRRKNFAEAIESCRRAVALQPDFAEAQLNLGLALQAQGDVESALECFAKAAAKLPALAQINAALAYAHGGRTEEGIDRARQAVGAAAGDASLHSQLLHMLHWDSRSRRRGLAKEHADWEARHARQFNPAGKKYRNQRNSTRLLKIGYVSPDFRSHAANALFEPLLDSHDRTHFQIVCYSSVRTPDAITTRLRGKADLWRDIAGLSDDRAAEQIEADGIDILIDICGHMEGNRLPIFARKPAPIQVSYLIYPDTTGLRTMDYRMTDSWQDPIGEAEEMYSETLVRLDPICWCYAPWTDQPISDLPLSRNGYVTFGSLNHPGKVNRSVVSAWARILKAVPNSRLLMRCDGPGVFRWFAGEFMSHGIDAKRLQWVGRQNLDEYLRTLSEIDIALDPFPYNGHVTSCDTLWMGTPMVSLPASLAVSRVGASILSNLQLPELIAADLDGYVEIARALANDPVKLRSLREGLRERMRISPLIDYARLCKRLEEALENMWRRWCESAPH